MQGNKVRLAVFASGGGSNLQALIDACKTGRLNARICVVITSNTKAYALTRAKNEGIPAYCLSLDDEIFEVLQKHGTQLIFLAGYLRKIGPTVLSRYDIYNIHPSLLPKYGGKGMYGMNVHKAVLASRDIETGISIHRVDSEYDTGPVIAQKTVPVMPGDTPETLAARVLEQEHIFIVDALKDILKSAASGGFQRSRNRNV